MTCKRLLFSLILPAALALSGCSKEEGDYNLTVLVTVEDDVKVANALVRVYVPLENSFIDYYHYTNEQGEAEFKFNNKVVVDAIATKGSFKACSFAEVERGENLLTIDLKPFGARDNGCDNTQ